MPCNDPSSFPIWVTQGPESQSTQAGSEVQEQSRDELPAEPFPAIRAPRAPTDSLKQKNAWNRGTSPQISLPPGVLSKRHIYTAEFCMALLTA